MIAGEKRFGRRRNSRLDSITMICANAESTSSILHKGHKLLNIVTRKLNKSLLCTVHCTALRGGELSFLDAECNEHLFSCWFATFYEMSIKLIRISSDCFGQNDKMYRYFSNHFYHLIFFYLANFTSLMHYVFHLCKTGLPFFSNRFPGSFTAMVLNTRQFCQQFWFTFNLDNFPRDTGCSSGGPEWRWWMVNKIKLNADPE